MKILSVSTSIFEKKNLIFIIFAMSCFIWFLDISLSAEYTIIRLTNNSYDDTGPQIDNGQVVWMGWDGNDWEIFLYDGTTVKQLTNNNYNDYWPQIHNGQVVWYGYDGNDYEIFLYDGTRTIQLTNNNYIDNNPSIHNGQVVWQGYDGHDYEIYWYDGSSVINFTNNQTDDFNPKIHNGQIAWNDYYNKLYFYDGTIVKKITDMGIFRDINNGQIVFLINNRSGPGFDVCLWDGNQILRLSDSQDDDQIPQIDNGQVVWMGYDGHDWEVFFYDGIRTIQLTNNNYDDLVPQIHNGQIAWSGYDGRDNEIFLYDGVAIKQLTNNIYPDHNPQIYNGQVVWSYYDGHDYEIFLAKPPAPPAVKVDIEVDGVPEETEDNPGAFVFLNSDDDNQNNTFDKDENGPINGDPQNLDSNDEDELVKAKLIMSPMPSSGIVTLSRENFKIRVWSDKKKGSDKKILYDTDTKEWNLPATIPAEVWIEGYTISDGLKDTGLKLSYKETPTATPISDEAKITVYVPDIKITEVYPIQTVKGARLVKDKAMMVRVLPEVTMHPTGVDVKLNKKIGMELIINPFDNPVVFEINNKYLYTRDGYTFVLDAIPSSDWAHVIVKWHLYKGEDAFNFDREIINDYKPSSIGNLDIIARIDPKNKIPKYQQHGYVTSTPEVVGKKPSYKIRLQRITRASLIHQKPIIDSFSQIVYFEAAHPLPADSIEPDPQDSIIDYYNATSDFLYVASFLILGDQSAITYAAGKDRAICIVPRNCIWGDSLGLSRPSAPYAVLVNEKTSSGPDMKISTASHELAHTYGWGEEYGSGWENLPYGTLVETGWDVEGVASSIQGQNRAKISVGDNYNDTPSNYYSFMNDGSMNDWATWEHYSADINRFTGNDPITLFVSGLIYKDGRVKFMPAYILEGEVTNLPTGTYSIKSFSKNGTILNQTNFNAEFSKSNTEPFAFAVPYNEKTEKIILTNNDTVLAEIYKTSYSPEINIKSITEQNGEYTITWDALDKDKNDISYIILYSSDNGQNWFPLSHNNPKNISFFSFKTDGLPGGNECIIKIIGSDGLNTTSQISNKFLVPDKSPVVSLIRPIDGSVFKSGQKVTLCGYGYDPEDGKLGDKCLKWTSDIDGEIGIGKILETQSLSIGKHIITLTGYDSLENTTSFSVNIEIVQDIIPDVSIKAISYSNQKLTVQLFNIGEDVYGDVSLYNGNNLIETKREFIPANQYTYVKTDWLIQDGIYEITALVSNIEPQESNEQNNLLTTTITIDTTPPNLQVSVQPTELWPPNHKMIKITPIINIIDNIDPNPKVQIYAESNEPEEGQGDGDTKPDIIINENNEIWLRAERSGKNKEGRIYKIIFSGLDASGNQSIAEAIVTVPHSKK